MIGPVPYTATHFDQFDRCTTVGPVTSPSPAPQSVVELENRYFFAGVTKIWADELSFAAFLMVSETP